MMSTIKILSGQYFLITFAVGSLMALVHTIITAEQRSLPRESAGAVLAQHNLKLITKKFASLVRRVTRNLREKGVPVEDLRVYLVHHLKFSSIKKSHAFSSAATIGDLLAAIKQLGLWDYLHIELLEDIIDEYATEDPSLQDMLQDYKQELAGFKLTTKLDQYVKFVQPVSEHSQYEAAEDLLPMCHPDADLFRKLSIVVGAKITEHSLKYVFELRKKVCRFLSLPPFAVILDKVDKGSVCVTWRIPAEFMSQVMQMVQDNRNRVDPELGAMSITVGNERVYCDPTEVIWSCKATNNYYIIIL